jgi:hypothetical protein
MKFRKKPVVIEAWQLTDESRWNNTEWPQWLHWAWNLDQGEVGRVFHSTHPEPKNSLWIYTLEGTLCASVGDWIIQGVKGELYPCKPDIFEATYEAVE